jgi:hypothetical protein
VTLVRLYFLASIALAAAGFAACRDLAREPDAAWWLVVAQWGFVALAAADLGILYVVRGEGDGDDSDAADDGGAE